MDKLAYRVNDVAKMLSVSPRTVWRHIKAGKLKTLRFGGATLIPASEVQKILRGEPAREYSPATKRFLARAGLPEYRAYLLPRDRRYMAARSQGKASKR